MLFYQCRTCLAKFGYKINRLSCPKCNSCDIISITREKMLERQKVTHFKIDMFDALLDKMKEIHDKKRKDYAGVDEHENFTRASTLSSWFTNDTDKVFASLIGVKLARLGNLLSNNKEPENESIEDTFVDAANYILIWATWRLK